MESASRDETKSGTATLGARVYPGRLFVYEGAEAHENKRLRGTPEACANLGRSLGYRVSPASGKQETDEDETMRRHVTVTAGRATGTRAATARKWRDNIADVDVNKAVAREQTASGRRGYGSFLLEESVFKYITTI
ncbi:hypothetical protein B0H11DRAFT_1923005 [Mycena galericulata]|nr:hypothetical protein B0H11DRAFT_1923005 [Mycena galericulata]